MKFLSGRGSPYANSYDFQQFPGLSDRGLQRVVLPHHKNSGLTTLKKKTAALTYLVFASFAVSFFFLFFDQFSSQYFNDAHS